MNTRNLHGLWFNHGIWLLVPVQIGAGSTAKSLLWHTLAVVRIGEEKYTTDVYQVFLIAYYSRFYIATSRYISLDSPKYTRPHFSSPAFPKKTHWNGLFLLCSTSCNHQKIHKINSLFSRLKSSPTRTWGSQYVSRLRLVGYVRSILGMVPLQSSACQTAHVDTE